MINRPLFSYEVGSLDELARLFAEWAERERALAFDTIRAEEAAIHSAEARAYTICAAVLHRTRIREK